MGVSQLEQEWIAAGGFRYGESDIPVNSIKDAHAVAPFLIASEKTSVHGDLAAAGYYALDVWLLGLTTTWNIRMKMVWIS